MLLRQFGSIIVMAVILLFAFRGHPAPAPRNRALILTSLSLALCLPMPFPDGVPVVIWIGDAVASPFKDNGHVGPWFAPMIAGISLAVYFTVAFLLLKVIAWIVTRRTR